MKRLLIIVCLSIWVASFSTAYGQNDFKVLKTFHIQSGGGWDYIAVGPGNNRLYVSHGTQVNILNLATGDSVGVIPNTTGVHGIAFDRSQNKGFTSNGRLNTVTVFNLSTNEVIAQVPAGVNPDAIMYEPFTKKIITCNGRSKDISIIDPVSNKLLDSIIVGGKPETAVSDGKGKLYVNIEDKNEIVVVNLVTKSVEAHWPLAPGEEPTGLAFDKKTNRLFAGCGNKTLVVMDAGSGKLIKSLPIGDGCDGAGFDPGTNNIFTSNGDGTLTIYHENANDNYVLLGNMVTMRGARTIAIDETTHLIYLPTAEFEAGDPNVPKARPRMIPGTFQVLVVGH